MGQGRARRSQCFAQGARGSGAFGANTWAAPTAAACGRGTGAALPGLRTGLRRAGPGGRLSLRANRAVRACAHRPRREDRAGPARRIAFPRIPPCFSRRPDLEKRPQRHNAGRQHAVGQQQRQGGLWPAVQHQWSRSARAGATPGSSGGARQWRAGARTARSRACAHAPPAHSAHCSRRSRQLLCATQFTAALAGAAIRRARRLHGRDTGRRAVIGWRARRPRLPHISPPPHPTTRRHLTRARARRRRPAACARRAAWTWARSPSGRRRCRLGARGAPPRGGDSRRAAPRPSCTQCMLCHESPPAACL